MIELRIRGLPAPQGSKRHVGRGIMVESSKRVAPWRQDVKLDSLDQYKGQPIDGPVAIEIIFWLPRPQGHYRTGKYAGQLKPNAPSHSTSCAQGDIDKLVRSTLDGLSVKAGGCIIRDDSLVVMLRVEKRYVTNSEGCGAYIRVIESQYDSIRSSAGFCSNAQALVCQ
jgi:crossover junction endodeoxyribonuclease RusA